MCLERLRDEGGHPNGAATTDRLRLNKDQCRLHGLQLLPKGDEVRRHGDLFGMIALSALQFAFETLPLREESSSRHGVASRSLEGLADMEHPALKV
jgi:hypothetical protein